VCWGTTYGKLQKIAIWFRANKMAVKCEYSKTKFIVFRTRGKAVNPNDCALLFNSNEPGQPIDPTSYHIIPLSPLPLGRAEKELSLEC
jgi:hypothetical protein